MFQICDWPHLVNCQPGSQVSTKSSKIETINTLIKPNKAKTSRSEKARKLPNGCPADFSKHYLIPHETYCDKFYSCSNGNRLPMNCPAGLSFDYKKQVSIQRFMVPAYVWATTWRVSLICHTYKPRTLQTFQKYLRDAHVLPKWLTYEEYCRLDRC
jgi:hypothetical protein